MTVDPIGNILDCVTMGAMTALTPIVLNTDWRSYPPEEIDPVYGASQLDESSWDIISTLSDWPRHLLGHNGTVHLRRKFDLEPIGDVCLRFMLRLEAAPDGTAVYVNGWHAGTIQQGQPLTSDVTDYVMLEGNVLLLNVTEPGRFGEVQLRRVPCDQPYAPH